MEHSAYYIFDFSRKLFNWFTVI